MPAVGVSAHSNKDHADDADEDQRGDKATAERDPWMGERIGDDSGDLLPYSQTVPRGVFWEDYNREIEETTDFIGAGCPFPSDPPTDPITFFLGLGAIKAA